MLSFLVLLLYPSLSLVEVPASDGNGSDTLTVISIAPVLGDVITADERTRFRLFPSIEHFESAVVLQSPSYQYFVRITRLAPEGVLPDTLIPYSGEFLSMYGERSQYFDQALKGEYVMGTDTLFVRYRTGRPPYRGNRPVEPVLSAANAPELAPADTEEVLVPFLPSKGIERFDAEGDVKTQLFSRFAGFQDASLFRTGDSAYVLEVRRRIDGELRRSRRPLTEAELSALRQRVSAAIDLRDPFSGIDQSGRSTFLGTAYSLSLGLYGWGVPVLANMKGSAAVGTYLLINAGTILLANGATESMEISQGMADMTAYGTGLGILHANMLTILFDENASFKAHVAASMAGSLVEGIAAYQISKGWKPREGAIDMLTTTTTVGVMYGYGTVVLMGQTTPKGIAASVLAGSLAGAGIGAGMMGRPEYTTGNMGVIRGGFMLGVYIPATVLIAANVDDDKAVVGTLMAGGVLGSVLGNGLIQGKRFTSQEGVLIVSGVLGGGLLAASVPVLAGADTKVSVVASGLGAAFGSGMMYSRYADVAAQRGSASGAWQFGPAVLLAHAAMDRYGAPAPQVMPALRLTMTF